MRKFIATYGGILTNLAGNGAQRKLTNRAHQKYFVLSST